MMIASLSADEGKTTLYIWKDDKSVIALVELYDEFVPVTRIYIKGASEINKTL